MPLSHTRLPLAALGIIALLGLLFLAIAVPVTADDAAGPIPGLFGDTAAALEVADVNNKIGWDWMASGTNAKIDLWLGSNWAGKVFGIEIFVDPTTGTKPLIDPIALGGALPTGRAVEIRFSVDPTKLQKPLDRTKSLMGIHLLSSDNLRGVTSMPLLISEAPRNTALLAAPPAAPPVSEAPPAPPVATVVVPSEQVKTVAKPAGGAVSLVQPSVAGTLASDDGKVSVSIPPLAYATTFQAVYNPTPATIPPAAARTKLLRAFELNAFDAAGTRLDLSLLRPITITIKYTADDAAAAPGKNPANLKIQFYDPTAKAWVTLNTTLDLAQQTLQASIDHLSLFSIATEEPPPQAVGTPTPTPRPATPTPTARPPVTGDITPSSGLILALLVAGFLLVTAGGTYLTRLGRRQS